MKKLLRMAIGTIFVFGLFLPGIPAYAATVQVTLPTFDVTLNGIKIDNATRQYPLIVYKDITYFPMTYDDCRFLGLESNYTAKDGLDIDKTGIGGRYNDYKMQESNPKKAAAQIAAFPIRLNGKTIDNNKEAYPLLLYKDITYFPLTWQFAVDGFGWDYSFDHSRGLVISSNNNYSKEYLIALVQNAIEKLQTSEWLTYNLKAFPWDFPNRTNLVHGILREHSASGTKWYHGEILTKADTIIIAHYLLLDGKLYYSENGVNWQTQEPSSFVFPTIPALAEMMQTLSDSDYEDTYFDYKTNTVELSYDFYTESNDSGWGSVIGHGFAIDLGGSGLRSYIMTSIPTNINENGERYIIPVPHVYSNVIDIDYQPFTIPTP